MLLDKKRASRILRDVRAGRKREPEWTGGKPPPKSVEAEWARQWRLRSDGWPHIIARIAGFDPKRIRWIERNCRLPEIASAWKDLLTADGYYAFDEI